MKRLGSEWMGGGGPAPKRFGSSPDFPFGIKVLVDQMTAGKIIGTGGTVINEIKQATGSRLHLSGRGEFYPGTSLQEINIQSPSPEAVEATVLQVLGRVMEAHGIEESSSDTVRMSIVVPRKSAATVIGKGGENIKNLRQQSGVRCHVQDAVVGSGDPALSEQVVEVLGSAVSLQTALQIVCRQVQEASEAEWFMTWLGFTHATSDGWGAPMPMKGFKSGKGCCKGGKADWGMPGKGKGPPPMAAIGGLGMPGGGWGPRLGGGGSGFAVAASDQVAAALHAVPHTALQGELQISFGIYREHASNLIGRGGGNLKQLCHETGCKIQIRDNEGEDGTTQSAHITGHMAGVLTTFIRVQGRIAELDDSRKGKGKSGPYGPDGDSWRSRGSWQGQGDAIGSMPDPNA